VEVVQTDGALGERMARLPDLTWTSGASSGGVVVDVDDHRYYQQLTGIGAALTDSAAWLISKLAPAQRLQLLQELFGTWGGIHLNFLRVPMAASDFTVSPQPYSYDDLPPGDTDPDLAHFSIAHDLAYILPTLRAVLGVDPGVEILANPWTPPAWLKTNDSLANPGGGGELRAEDYAVWAQYFVKFIRAYAAAGVPIDALTPQNEPGTPGMGTPYPGLTMSADQEGQFIHFDLAPALRAAGLTTRIYGSDLSWVSSPFADALASGPAAGDLAGIAWHCYFGSPTAMTQLAEAEPRLDQIVDECSPEIRPFGTPELLISSLRNGASVVALWNVALDPQGGPKQAANGCPGCRGVARINEQTGAVSFGSEYDQLGQVSRFVEPGARRIDSNNFVTYGVDGSGFESVSGGLDDVAFVNPDGSKVLIANNTSSSAIAFAVDWRDRSFSYTVPAGAMVTFRWE
jgi:glucosylceramidase